MWLAIFHGGQFVRVSAPLEISPFWIIAGTIIPVLDPAVDTLVRRYNSSSPIFPPVHNEKVEANPKIIFLEDAEKTLHLWVFPDRFGNARGGIWDGTNFTAILHDHILTLSVSKQVTPTYHSEFGTVHENVRDSRALQFIWQVSLFPDEQQCSKVTKVLKDGEVEKASSWNSVANQGSPLNKETFSELWYCDSSTQTLWVSFFVPDSSYSSKMQIYFGEMS